jgi:general secretion pathway protein D
MSRSRIQLILLVLAAGLAFAQEPAKTDAPATVVTTAAPAAAPAQEPAKTEAPAASTTTSTAPAADNGTVRSPFAVDGLPDALASGPIDPDKVEVSIAFNKADLANVLAFLSLASGIPIVCDADVKGTVTITSVRKVTLTTAYAVINSALRVRGYTMVGTLKDKLIRVMPLKKAIADKASVQIGADPDALGSSDVVITQVVPLQYITASKLKDELKPLVADDQANLLAVSSTNSLVVTDTEGNIKRLLQIIALMDKDTSDMIDIDVYTCKNANATVMVAALEKIFNITPTANAAMRGGQPNQGGQPPQGQPGAIRTDDGVMSVKGELRITADQRTNSLIISATKEKIKVVRGLIEKLDINTTPEVKARTFPLTYANATAVADQLNKIFEQPQGGAGGQRQPWWMPASQQQVTSDYAGLKRNVVVPDVRTNSVVVTATEQNMLEFERMIKSLDAPNVLSDIARTFQLKYAKATTVAQSLNNLFRGNTQRMSFFDLISGNNQSSPGDPITSLRNITVVAEEKTNTLLVTGQPQVFPMVQSMIEKLDRRTPQVFIEVAIVDVTLDDATKFGVEWSWSSTGRRTSGEPNQSIGSETQSALEKALVPHGLRYSVLSGNLQALLHALTTRSDVKVYSTPSITTADNVAASISIGQDIPYISSTETTAGGSTVQTVDFKNVSIALNVTPHVSTSDLISLDVQQTINEKVDTEPITNAPIVANRQAKTTVMVNDAQTIVIGGIIKDNTSKINAGVPVLSKIPGLGELFKSRTNERTKSELMVFLTPHILRDDEAIENTTAQERNKLGDALKPALPAPAGPPAPEKK